MAGAGTAQYSPRMSETADDFEIGPPPTGSQRSALELALDILPQPQRLAAIDDLLAAVARGERSLEGLLAAWQGHHLVGALWAELHPGQSAGIWPPRTIAGSPPRLADDLLARAITLLESKQVGMAQCLLATDAGENAERLRRAGFEHPCDLLYLVSHAGHFPTSPVATSLEFWPVEPADLDRLARLIEATYKETLDCPTLDGRRDCRQVVAGYQATCRHDLSHWFVVRSHGDDLGCLLLANDAPTKSWELVYMGLVPAARGRGLGIELVRHAQWLVARQGGQRLVLAVDAANQPALNIYAASGFVAWDKRSVFLKFLSPVARTLPNL